MDPGIRNTVSARLEADASVDDSWGALVLAALGGSEGLEAALAGTAASPHIGPSGNGNLKLRRMSFAKQSTAPTK